jgi:hypothetical protein
LLLKAPDFLETFFIEHNCVIKWKRSSDPPGTLKTGFINM